MTDYRARESTPQLLAALRRMPAVVLSGLRQTGKSTLLTEEPALRGRSYRSLDDFPVLAAARQNPETLLDSPEPLTLDEAQRCPELLLALKSAVDRRRQAGRFLLSGSANLALMARVSETLAGRAVYLTLHPMTRREIHRRTGRRPALLHFLEDQDLPSGAADPVSGEEILQGGLPPVCLESPQGAALWFRGYVQTYIERDVRQLSQIADLVSFQTLVNLAALRTAQVLNLSLLARDARLTSATTTRYANLLETSFLIRRLPAFRKNRSSRLIKAPKLYFTDSGLASHLAQAGELDKTAADPLYGALVETWVVQNVTAILDAHLPGAALSYWHEQGRHEVDLVIESGRKIFAIEIKAASRWSDVDFSSLRAFLDRTPQCQAAILAYNGKTAHRLGGKLWAVPLGHLVS